MKKSLLIFATLLFTISLRGQTNTSSEYAHHTTLETAKAQREARKEAYASNISHIIESRDYIFRPVTMQNVVTGNTRDIFAYYLYAAILNDKVILHLPVEFTSYIVDTINLDAFTEGYSSSLIDGNWRITFSFMNGTERWFAEFFLSTITGQARLAIVTPKGVMRYLGTIEAGNTLRQQSNKATKRGGRDKKKAVKIDRLVTPPGFKPGTA